MVEEHWPAAAEGSDRLPARRAGRDIAVTVAQIRQGLQPHAPALTALASVTGTGVLRRLGADQFAAGPLPLSLLCRDGAEPGEVLAWNGLCWAPAAVGTAPAEAGARRVITRAVTALVVGREECGAIISLVADGEATVLLPASLPAGSELTVLQGGDGPVRFVAGPGASVASRRGHTRTAGRHARVELVLVDGAADGPPVWLLSGDTAP